MSDIERHKVTLRKSTPCKKCRQTIGGGLRAVAVATRDGEKRGYHHECADCARDWHAL